MSEHLRLRRFAKCGDDRCRELKRDAKRCVALEFEPRDSITWALVARARTAATLSGRVLPRPGKALDDQR